MKCQTSGSTHFTKYKKLGNMFLGLLFEEVCSKGNGGALGTEKFMYGKFYRI
jgi:hypothetical protein